MRDERRESGQRPADRGPSSRGTLPRYRWEERERAPLEHLRGFPSIHPLLVQILWNRDIRGPEEMASFMDAAGRPLGAPSSMLGMAEAVARILRARSDGEPVAVYGDYDVDGLTGTTLVLECLRLLGLDPISYVPRRDREGYGLNRGAIESLRRSGVTLIVTVDNGISAVGEIEYARDLGVDVIVTDHHHVPSVVPRATAILNPQQSACAYPFKALCGVGIADRLARALLEADGQDPSLADQWLDLVTVGTIADVVSLTGENRTLVERGLVRLNPPRRPGLLALAEKSGVGQRRVTSTSVGYALAPRLNAAGRIDDASLSLRLLLTRSRSEADDLANQLDLANRDRQRLTADALSVARSEILRRLEESGDGLPRFIVVADERYRQGVAGLVAAKLVEEYGRPALVAEVAGDQLRGSARSINRFHVTEALARCDDLLDRFGGHAMAAGFATSIDRFEELRRRLELIGRAEIADADLVPSLTIDAVLTLRRFDSSLAQLLERLEPYGCDNPRPVFLSRHVQVLERRVVGQETPGHLKLKLADATTRWDAIGFRLGDRLADITEFVDVVYSVERDEWNGRVGTQLRLLDLAPAGGES